MKYFLYKSVIGIFFGAFLMVVITSGFIIFTGLHVLDAKVFLQNAAGTIFLGWTFTVSPFYFSIQRLSRWQQTLLHFITVSIPFFLVATAIGWIPTGFRSFLIMIGIFIAIYLILWSGFYFYYKNLSEKLNDELKKI